MKEVKVAEKALKIFRVKPIIQGQEKAILVWKIWKMKKVIRKRKRSQ
jgi:hypothetical protein